MTVTHLHHASVPRPAGEAADRTAVQFYSGVLGLEHIPKPSAFTDIEVTWFRAGDNEIHIYALDPGDENPHSAAHFCLAVDDVEETKRLLESSGHWCGDAAPIPGRPRFFTRDPFDNMIEITELSGHRSTQPA